MSALLYAVFTALIATVDSVYRDAPAYTVTNIALRIAVLLPLLFSIVGGASRYTRALRRTLWWVMVADVLLGGELRHGVDGKDFVLSAWLPLDRDDD